MVSPAGQFSVSSSSLETGTGAEPLTFKLVAVSGTPTSAMTASVAGWSGTRMPTVPLIVTSRSGSAGVFATTTESGPGVKAPSNLSAAGVSTPTDAAIATDAHATCMTGEWSRCFTANARSTAGIDVAIAASM